MGILEQLYGTARDALFGNVLFFATVAAIFLGLEAVLLTGSPIGLWAYLVLNLALVVPLAFVGHRIILLNEKFRARDIFSTRVIPSRQFLLTTAPFYAVNLALQYFANLIRSGTIDFGNVDRPIYVIGPIFIIVLLYFYALSRFGSALPAAAIGTDSRLTRANQRSKSRRWFNFQNILIGPILYGFLIKKVFVEWEKLGLDAYLWGSNGQFSIQGSFMSYLSYFAGSFTLLLLIAVFCDDYRSGEAVLETATK
jgi:hypothetical protein